MKSRARTDRWLEEVKLLREEMRRTAVFLKWRSDLWTKCAAMGGNSDAMRAYASKQAAVFLAVEQRCRRAWAGCDVNYTNILAPNIGL